MPLGHFTSISATGPGSKLWYTSDGSWSSNEGSKFVFPQTQIAVHTAMLNLPTGYHTQVNFETVPVPPRDNSPLVMAYPCSC